MSQISVLLLWFKVRYLRHRNHFIWIRERSCICFDTSRKCLNIWLKIPGFLVETGRRLWCGSDLEQPSATWQLSRFSVTPPSSSPSDEKLHSYPCNLNYATLTYIAGMCDVIRINLMCPCFEKQQCQYFILPTGLDVFLFPLSSEKHMKADSSDKIIFPQPSAVSAQHAQQNCQQSAMFLLLRRGFFTGLLETNP